jgi:hypothetical protein
MILSILNELESTSSRLEKEAILKREQHNALLKRVFFLAYDPFTQFYIRKIPAYKQIPNYDISLEEALNQLDLLSSRVVTGNAAIEHLRNILCNIPEHSAKVIERVIAKDLKCGASESTANKIWPGLIHEYPCMLASGYDQKLVDKMSWPAMAQLKMDGMRFNAIVKHTAIDSTVEFRSRNGKEINLLGNLEKEFIKLSAGKDCVFDGELMVMFPGDDQFADRQTGNGILNKAVKGTIGEEQASMVHATIWDIIPYEDFQKGVSNVIYITRFNSVKEMISTIPPKDKKIWLVSYDIVDNIDEAREKFNEYYSLGLEGIILKSMYGIWEDKRAKHQIKFKGELECDLKVVDIQPGTGKYTGMLGALICESDDGVLKVDIGSGFKDFQRLDFTSDSIVGKIVSVKYNARIKNKQGEESLFLPVFVEVREDKDTADSSKEIK